VATFFLFISKTLKNASKNDFASASSLVVPSHYFEKAIALSFISFQLKGIVCVLVKIYK